MGGTLIVEEVDVIGIPWGVEVDRGVEGGKFQVWNDECTGYLDECAGEGEDVMLGEVGFAGLSPWNSGYYPDWLPLDQKYPIRLGRGASRREGYVRKVAMKVLAW